MAFSSSSTFTVAAIALLAWSTFAFGGVYPLAYSPILVGCLTTGVLGILGSRSSGVHNRAIVAAFVALVLSIGVQTIPLSGSFTATLSGTREPTSAVDPVATLRSDQLDQEVRSASHTVSRDPAATRRAMMFLVALGILFWGSTRALAGRSTRTLSVAIVWIGMGLALIAIVQRAVSPSKAYGFWIPYFEARPFGPFINYNHFAGWMLMAIAIGGGYFLALLDIQRSDESLTWRTRVLWLSSAEASARLLLGSALLLMTLAVTLTTSRSGISCLMLALLLIACSATRAQWTTIQRALVVTSVAAAGLVSVMWVGPHVIAQRFAALGDRPDGRIAIWRDTLPMLRDNWVTGAGINAYPAASLGYVRPGLAGTAEEAHSDYLQLAAEGGVLVVGPALLLAALFIKEVMRRFREDRPGGFTRWLRTGAVIGLITIAAQELVEFSLQIPANAVLFTLLCAIAVHRPSAAPARQYRSC